MEDQLYNLERLLRRVERYLALSTDVVHALGNGDETQIRSCLTLARQQRDAIRHADRVLAQPAPANGEMAQLVIQLGKWKSRVDTDDALIAAWLETWRAPEADLLRTPNGVARLIDLLLPLEWNPQLDLAILIGSGGHALAQEFDRRGQQRLFVLHPATQPPEEYPACAIVMPTFADLREAICANLCGPRPAQFLVHRMSAPDVTDDDQRQTIHFAKELVQGRHHFNFGTLLVSASRWVEQSLANLPAVASLPSVRSLQNAFAGQPAIVVSPGPSLRKNLELLSTLRDRAVLLSSIQTLRPLSTVHLLPHLSLVMDAGPMDYFLDGLSPAQIGRLGLAMHVHPSLFELSVPKLTFSGNALVDGWLIKLFDDSVSLPSGGSVSCGAYALARFFGCDPIILVGQDLSFQDGQVYVDSSVQGRSKATFNDQDGSVRFQFDGMPDEMQRITEPMMRQEAIELAGYYGGTVRTSSDFSIFHSWFEAAARIDAGKRQLFNCTEGGAYIKGMEHQPLSEVAARYLRDRFDADGIFDAGQTSADNRAKRREIVLRWSEEKQSRVHAVAALATRCLLLIERSLAGDAESLATLAAAESALSQELRELPFLSMLKQREIHTALEAGRIATTLEENLGAAQTLYEQVLDGANRVAPLLEKIKA